MKTNTNNNRNDSISYIMLISQNRFFVHGLCIYIYNDYQFEYILWQNKLMATTTKFDAFSFAMDRVLHAKKKIWSINSE
jgi:hypothetical protein